MKKAPFPYQIIIRWSTADDSYEADVPALRTCIAYGNTPVQAVREVMTAATVWLRIAKADGMLIPAPDVSRSDMKRLVNIHPGEVLRLEFLAPLRMSQRRLSEATGLPLREVRELVNERRSVTADTAKRLAQHFGTSKEVWLNLQKSYDAKKAKQKSANRCHAVTD